MIKPTVFQLIIGKNIPEKYLVLMEKWKNYCKYYNYNYKLYTKKNIKGSNKRIESDKFRINILSKYPYHAWADWDTYPSKYFQLNEDHLFNGDYFLYNGNNLKIIKDIKNEMKKYKGQCGSIYYAMCNLKIKIMTPNIYIKHLNMRYK